METLVKLLQAEEETEELPEQVSCADYLDSNVKKIEMQKVSTFLFLKAFKQYIVR